MDKYSNEEISEIKQSARTILNMVTHCPGGSSYIIINNICIIGDIGYVLEFCEKVLKDL